MTPSARYQAAVDILAGFLAGDPVEKRVSNWARSSRYAGSKDRAAVRDIVFDCLRNLRSYQGLAGIEGPRGLILGHMLASGIDPDGVFADGPYAPTELTAEERGAMAAAPAGEVIDLPDWLATQFQADLGAEVGTVLAELAKRAPVDLRVNLAKVTVEKAQAALLKNEVHTEAIGGVPAGLRVTQNPRRVAGSDAFAKGLVEIQDAGSQALADLVPISKGDRVLDYCAGGGGKTLAMAARVLEARFAAWDISAARLAPLADRAARAGVRVDLLKTQPTDPYYDVVLADAPCSGAGAWRRNPEGKWRLTQDRLRELVALQRQVIRDAVATVRAGGVFVYATCSILRIENQEQRNWMLAEFPDMTLDFERSFTVGTLGDGFYILGFQKQP